PCTRNLRICVPSASRTTGWASFDGRFRQELSYGDSIVVSFSPYPITTVCREDPSRDWFRSLERCLNWNDRKRQKPFSASQLAGTEPLLSKTARKAAQEEAQKRALVDALLREG
ncbi:MAG: hypothetical protein BJ554DRAFT_4524, partial [Olpidium bornovanus]